MNRLPLDPQLNDGQGLMFSLKMRLREIARLFNATADQVDTNTTNIGSLTTSDAGKVNRAGDTMTGALNLVGNSTAVTQAASDNSTRIATTAWVYGAMATIATAAGFAASLGSATGYIKLPSWLGGFVLQWGTSVVTTDASGNASISFPLTFPTAVRAVVAANGDASVGNVHVGSYTTGFPTTSAHAIHCTLAATGGNFASSGFRCNWAAFGQ